jgi:hypothetical protein
VRRALGIVTVAAAALLAAGCFPDQTTWQSTGPIVEEVRHVLIEEHHAKNPDVECIKREAQGALYECRAETAEGEFECELERSLPKQETKALECHGGHEEEHAPANEEHAPTGDEHAPAEKEKAPADEHAGG